MSDRPADAPPRSPDGPEPGISLPRTTTPSTAVLLARVRVGDDRAREALAVRFLGPLRRWARGRLPVSARDLVDTDDIVQATLVRAFNRVDQFEPRGEGAFFGYLRQILLNQIRDEVRRSRRRPPHEDLAENLSSNEESPLEQAVGRQNLERYERALTELPPTHREAVILKLEMGYRYREVAVELGLPTANAARKLVGRALLQLAGRIRG